MREANVVDLSKVSERTEKALRRIENDDLTPNQLSNYYQNVLKAGLADEEQELLVSAIEKKLRTRHPQREKKLIVFPNKRIEKVTV